jgi:hypothetical protein
MNRIPRRGTDYYGGYLYYSPYYTYGHYPSRDDGDESKSFRKIGKKSKKKKEIPG